MTTRRAWLLIAVVYLAAAGIGLATVVYLAAAGIGLATGWR